MRVLGSIRLYCLMFHMLQGICILSLLHPIMFPVALVSFSMTFVRRPYQLRCVRQALPTEMGLSIVVTLHDEIDQMDKPSQLLVTHEETY